MPTEPVLVDSEKLKSLVYEIFASSEVPEEEAEEIADHLVLVCGAK